MAVRGEVRGVERLWALNPGLYRDEDLTNALEAVVPVDGHPEYTLQLARAEVLLGRYERARGYFETYLSTEQNADALIEFAHLQFELYRFAEAEQLFRRASALRPGDLTLRIEIAESLMLQNRANEALKVYAELAGETTSEDVLGPYIRLAESLGRYDDFTRGLQRRIERDPTNAGRDHLMLAYGYELANNTERRGAALEEGLRLAPQNNDLRLQLAFALANEKKHQAAQAALATHTSLHEDAVSAVLYMELMRLNNDTAAERAFLATPLAPALAADETVREHLARAYEALSDFKAAESVWRDLLAHRPNDLDRASSLARVLLTRGNTAEASRVLQPFLAEPTPTALRLVAQIAGAAGDHRTAEKYQLAYLDAVQSATATEWGALGDIRLSRGDRTGAKRAYAEALRRLQAQIVQSQGSPP